MLNDFGAIAGLDQAIQPTVTCSRAIMMGRELAETELRLTG